MAEALLDVRGVTKRFGGPAERGASARAQPSGPIKPQGAMSPMTEALLEVRGVTKRFGGARGAWRLGTCAAERADKAARSYVSHD